MERDAYRLLARTIKALAHPTRLAILSLLLVTSRREGLRILYRVSDERLFEALDLLSSIARKQLVEATEALASLMPSNLQGGV
jgi:DNA-binding transcriptional ArsR family regulator